jgi:hypothetical protein
MEKSRVVEALSAQLEQSYERMLEAARKTEEAATDPENRAENKYDTRGLEASYLAAGQSEQLADMADALRKIQQATFREFSADEAIDAGALVGAEFGGETDYFLLAPAAGGMLIEIDDCEINVLAPGAPLRDKLLGLCVGDEVSQPSLKVMAVQ